VEFEKIEGLERCDGIFTELPTCLPDFSSFKSSSITLQLSRFKISVYDIYHPPSSSPLSKRNYFFDNFNSFLSFAANTPHEFMITGDFNIHLDSPTDHLTSQFLSLLSSFNLTQRVNFPTHNKHHILNLVITPSDYSLAPSLSSSHCSPSVFTRLSINPSPLPPSTLHSFRQLHSIDISSFLTDLKSSRLITLILKSVGSFLIAYNTALSFLLDKHTPVITKLTRRQSPLNPWFIPALCDLRSTVHHAETLWKHTHSAVDCFSYKSLCSKYHNLIVTAKKFYYSNLVFSSSDNLKRLWRTVSKLLHHKSPSPLPSAAPDISLADSFASVFTDNV